MDRIFIGGTYLPLTRENFVGLWPEGVNKKNVLASYRINISPQRAQNTFLHVLGVLALHVFQV